MPNKWLLYSIMFLSFFTIGWQIPKTASLSDTIVPKYAICGQPTVNAERCATQEAQILASVVRIILHANFQIGGQTDFRGNVGHATVMSGRYLVTHNHFSIDLVALSPTNTQGLTGFSLYTALGKRLVDNAPISTFQVSAQDSQTLVLDFGEDYFNKLNLPSASFMVAEDANLTIGMEVAQIDWDGARAYVVWTTVTQVSHQASSPHLELDHYAMVGASGGGVYWRGHHIANNWMHVTITDSDSGAFRRAYSLAATNDSNVFSVLN
jgi:hypothetical protein